MNMMMIFRIILWILAYLTLATLIMISATFGIIGFVLLLLLVVVISLFEIKKGDNL